MGRMKKQIILASIPTIFFFILLAISVAKFFEDLINRLPTPAISIVFKPLLEGFTLIILTLILLALILIVGIVSIVRRI